MFCCILSGRGFYASRAAVLPVLLRNSRKISGRAFGSSTRTHRSIGYVCVRCRAELPQDPDRCMNAVPVPAPRYFARCRVPGKYPDIHFLSFFLGILKTKKAGAPCGYGVGCCTHSYLGYCVTGAHSYRRFRVNGTRTRTRSRTPLFCQMSSTRYTPRYLSYLSFPGYLPDSKSRVPCGYGMGCCTLTHLGYCAADARIVQKVPGKRETDAARKVPAELLGMGTNVARGTALPEFSGYGYGLSPGKITPGYIHGSVRALQSITLELAMYLRMGLSPSTPYFFRGSTVKSELQSDRETAGGVCPSVPPHTV